ncbi:MAG: hypothetical protein UY63_C0013G0022 [Parcubacteria group bacterium GW2011_GWA2_51_10]|nr:MAG: hypothetical protein UY63_C0013G0022 [Parcubacteria group bacterium GW2011_GWA2_51_10]
MAMPKSEIQEFWHVLTSFDWETWTDWVFDWGISRGAFLGLIYVALLAVLSIQIPNFWLFALTWIAGTAPVWLPVAMIITAYRVWIWYARSHYLASKVDPVLLEMKIPREITKSPRAMETALTAFWMGSHETTFIHRFVKGQVRPFYSFEIASFGGELHFYVWVFKAYQKSVESNLYSQYPDIELVEVEDYSQKFVFDEDKYTCYCTDWRLEGSGIDPRDPRINAYPFKTYIDLELDKDPKEELKVDPLATVLEFMASIKPTEQMWIQIIFTAAYRTGVINRRDTAWKHLVETEVQKIRLESAVLPEKLPEDISERRLAQARPRATWKQTEQVQTMERNLAKHPFDVGVRGIIIAPTEDFDRTFWSLRWIWRPFANPQYMTQLRPRRWHNPFDYPWQDFHDIRWNLVTRRFLDAYRRRAFFYTPWETPYNIMTSEMLATIFHPPSRTIATPGITRIPATKAEPPANLPR